MSKKVKLTNEAVLMALFAAFISAGCFIQVPFIGGVPIVFQDMLAVFAGLMLGGFYAAGAVVIFLSVGILGLPVFSGKAGFHVILHGVTGGFLIGYLFAAFISGVLSHFFLKKTCSNIKTYTILIISSVIAMCIIFTCGVLGFMRVMSCGLTKAFALVVIPFIPGTILKIILLVLLGKKFCPIINNYISR